jgi:C-terminal processing protease CtpA/Prc
MAKGATSPSDTYDSIRFAIKALGDNHSFFAGAKAMRGQEEKTVDHDQEAMALPHFVKRETPEGHLLKAYNQSFALLVVPRFSVNPNLLTAEVRDAFATKIRENIHELAADKPIGWIVDLRGNAGGNMWPMLAGVGPLLAGSAVGSFYNSEGTTEIWYYENGKAGVREPNKEFQPIAGSTHEPLVIAGLPPVAVLIDKETASSGENIAIAFRGRENTKFFGEPTYGLSTANQQFNLPDGAAIFLTTAIDADRTGKRYESGITPDYFVKASEELDPSKDPVVQRAIKWLRKAPAR